MSNLISAAFIQARMSSTRFPGKVLQKLGDKTVLETVVERVGVSGVTHVFVITSNNPADDPIVRLCEEKRIKCFRGEEENVLKRLLDAASMIVCDVIVDVTSDCPLIDPGMIWTMLTNLDEKGLDYCSNVMVRSWPDGLDIQVYRKDALLSMVSNYGVHTEHTGWNFIPLQDHFKCENMPAPDEYRHPDWAITLDHPEDLDLLRLLVEVGTLKCDYSDIWAIFSTRGILDFLNRHPWLLKINQDKERRAVSHNTFMGSTLGCE